MRRVQGRQLWAIPGQSGGTMARQGNGQGQKKSRPSGATPAADDLQAPCCSSVRTAESGCKKRLPRALNRVSAGVRWSRAGIAASRYQPAQRSGVDGWDRPAPEHRDGLWGLDPTRVRRGIRLLIPRQQTLQISQQSIRRSRKTTHCHTEISSPA